MANRNSLRRGLGTRSPHPTVSIYCEGKTEEQYFRQVRSDLRAASFRVTSVAGNPLDIVRYAIADMPKSDRLPNDQIWCVFDVEAPECRPRLGQALELANAKRVSCAVSHPCFEVWPLLHFVDHRGYLTSHQACRMLAGHLANYTTRRKLIEDKAYQELKARYQDASRRARALETWHGDAPVKECNPSTSVWRLMEALEALYGRV